MVLRWLLPLGFTGLVAIAVLLAIYILKPQYKEQRVSGTTIWKRVLLHSKKKRLIFSNFLIFLVQALVLAIIAAGFAEPRLYAKSLITADSEYIFILDASASMRAKSLSDGETRFGRATKLISSEVDKFFSSTEDGTVSLILADASPSFVFSDLKKSDAAQAKTQISNQSCTLEECDIEGALKLAEAQLKTNPYAKVLLYTDTDYGALGTAVEIKNVTQKESEQNVAVLGCNVGIQSNEYVFELVLGAYGNVTRKCNISVDIRGAANGESKTDYHLTVPVSFEVDETTSSKEQIKRVAVTASNEAYGGSKDWLFQSYDEVEINIPNQNDSLPDDDRYFVYSGIRDEIKFEYWSSHANMFWRQGIVNLANNMTSSRQISYREIYFDQGMLAESSGYDFYIFEHSIPNEVLESGLPKDGIVLLVDPDTTVNAAGIGLTYASKVSLPGLTGCSVATHELTKYLDPSRIRVTEYSKLAYGADSGFEPLLFLDSDPLLLVKNTASEKIVVMPFSINMSDFYTDQFQIFLYNLVNYFSPITLQKNDFTLGESTLVSCKGEYLNISFLGEQTRFSDFPAEYRFNEVGTYTFTVEFGIDRANEVRRAYVHTATSESELFAESDFRANLENIEVTGETGTDFFIWLAVSSLVLMIIEWYLQFKYIL